MSPTAVGWVVVAFCFLPGVLYALVAFLRRPGARRPERRPPSHAAESESRRTGQLQRHVVYPAPGESPPTRPPADGDPLRG